MGLDGDMKFSHYFIFGSQSLEVKEKTEEVKEGFLKQYKDAEYSRFDAGDFFKQDRSHALQVLEEFQNRCETVSFFQSPVIVEIINLQNVQGKPAGGDTAEHPGVRFVGLLKSYLGEDDSRSHFILSALIKKTSELKSGLGGFLEKRTKVLKQTISYDDFNPVSWVVDRGRKKGLMFDHYTAGYLIELAGSDLAVLDMELEKLSLLHTEGAHLHHEHLLASVSHSKSFTVFRISQFLSKRDLKNALESLEIVMTGKSGELIGLSGLISSQFRRLLKIAWMVDAGALSKDIEKQLKLSPWLVAEMMKLLKNYSLEELENIVVYWSRLDQQLKFSGVDGVLLLKDAFRRIATGELKHYCDLELSDSV